MKTFAPETCHEHMMDHLKPVLGFDPKRPYGIWRKKVDKKLRELIGLLPEKVDPDIRIEFQQDHPEFHERRLVFATEPGADVPCHLLVPKKGNAPFPVVICVQGHSTGMHNSLGRPKFEKDEEGIIKYSRDFGIQAVREGYAALVMEQRCFGERQDSRPPELRSLRRTCDHASMVAIALGRTMIGERVWDVSRAIDMMSAFPEVDTSRVGCMGNSGGGTTTYFAGCLEPRISVSMPSCFVCTFRGCIGSIDHCACNYVPNIMQYFEMGDLACLIAPRPLIVVAGLQDNIFPIAEVRKNFDLIQSIYAKAGVADKCRLVVGESGHQFYPQLGWPAFRELAQW